MRPLLRTALVTRRVMSDYPPYALAAPALGYDVEDALEQPDP